MSWIKRLGGRLPDFEDVVRRFPVAVVVMAVATVWLIFQIHMDDISGSPEYVFGGFVLAGYAAVIGRLIGEARSWSPLKSTLLSMVLALLAFLICAFGESLNFLVPLAIGGAILLLGSAAAWRRPRNDASVWNFTQKLWTGAIFAVVGSVIFAAGMFIISEAVKALFGVNLEDVTIKTVLPIALLFLAPVYWMGTLPRYGEAEDVAELSFEARALSFLGTWMLAPLVTIYALIILAYGAKILVQWELPKGEIAQLVSPFLGVGMLVWLMLEPKVLKEGAFVKFYRAVWHWIMLPAATLLGVAVFVRVHAYGFTPVRFFLALIVVWALTQSLWFIVGPNRKRDIRIPTAIAAGLLMFGAFTAFPISISHQVVRAKAALTQLEPLTKATLRANPTEAEKFRSSLDFLLKHEADNQVARLLPSKDLPISERRKEWVELKKEAGLSQNRRRSARDYYSIRIEAKLPADLPAGELHGPFTIYVSDEGGDVYGNIVKKSNDLKLTIKALDQTFKVDFTDYILEAADMDSNINVNLLPTHKIPPLPLLSDQSQDALFITINGGTVTYRYDEITAVRINGYILVTD